MNIKPGQNIGIEPSALRAFESDSERIADTFKKKFDGGFIPITTETTDDELIAKILTKRILGASFNEENKKELEKIKKQLPGIITILRATIDVLKPKPKEEKKPEPPPEPEEYKTETPKVGVELKVVHDEELEGNFAQYQEVEKVKEEKDSILDGTADIDAIYDQVSQLEKSKTIETDEYYYEFMKLGYTKEEINKNLLELKEREEQFAKSGSLDKKRTKKISAMTEIALEYGVSQLKWYGDNIEIRQTSRFDDVKRGVDGVLEIRKEKTESDFIGLGIDVTFRGLKSEEFKDKIFKLLRSIAEGYKTKIKFLKKRDGTLKKEFAVPKTVLSFDTTDVKNLSYMLIHTDDEKVQNSYKEHNIKFEIMNQTMVECEKLSAFAKKHGNNIDKGYKNALQSIEDLKVENDTIARAISSRHGSEFSQKFDALIQEFEEVWQKELVEKQKLQIVRGIGEIQNQEEKVDENEDYNIESLAA